MLRSSTAISFSWWPPQGVMPCPWGEVSPLQKRVPPGPPLVELTPLEWESEASESEVDEALT